MFREEAIILIGLQASGKTSFYNERFSSTHLHVNLDMLGTRYRERTLIQTCVHIGQPMVIDNTNLDRKSRAKYFSWMSGKWRKVGYYFRSSVSECLARNAARDSTVPDIAIKGSSTVLELPSLDEGFKDLYYVSIVDGKFVVEDWEELSKDMLQTELESSPLSE